MRSKRARSSLTSFLVICAPLALALDARPAQAWSIGSQINEDGCHEPITAAALRAVRATLDTAPALTPTRDEAAMIDDVMFAPPKDFVRDLAGMALVLGVRDNDLKGLDPLQSLELIQVHGNPATQMEHCIRGEADDEAAGNQSALAACRKYIVETAISALDGLDANGRVDASNRTPFTVYVSLRGKITVPLPLFYVRMGAAMHAIEDGFPHTYRSADGMKVTVVLNWIDLVDNNVVYLESRDGPPHRGELDRCWNNDPVIARNYALATQAATELLHAALDPALSREQKIEQFGTVTTKYLSFQPGCTFDNNWCDSPEASVTSSSTGCDAAGNGGLALALVMLGLIAVRRRRRDHALVIGGALLVAVALGSPARADDATPPAPAPAPPAPAPSPETVAATKAADAPAVPIPASNPAPKDGTEPGRDEKTPTVKEVAEVRADKELGNAWGFAASVGGSVDRLAGVSSLGVRYRLDERWIVGFDGGWNPWATTSPMKIRSGVATASFVVIRRFPMAFDRVNLRTSLHLGVSTLLFDVYGAPKYSTGPYGALSILGLDYDLGSSVRIVCDPLEVALPMPLIGQLPLYYEQFRFMIGIQIGA
jgi:uncharacterized protein (TIGR03382 family)